MPKAAPVPSGTIYHQWPFTMLVLAGQVAVAVQGWEPPLHQAVTGVLPGAATALPLWAGACTCACWACAPPSLPTMNQPAAASIKSDVRTTSPPYGNTFIQSISEIRPSTQDCICSCNSAATSEPNLSSAAAHMRL